MAQKKTEHLADPAIPLLMHTDPSGINEAACRAEINFAET
jgi:hypothetical protein